MSNSFCCWNHSIGSYVLVKNYFVDWELNAFARGTSGLVMQWMFCPVVTII